MKKPKELTKEQWAKYKGDLDLSLNVMNKALDVIADANFQAGEQVERERIIKLLFTWGIKSREENNWRDDVIALELIDLIKGEQK